MFVDFIHLCVLGIQLCLFETWSELMLMFDLTFDTGTRVHLIVPL